jgi:hypothetical protein
MKGIPNEPWQSQKRSSPPPELKPAHDHTLKHDPFTGRWSCKCGYVLGDGREKLLAPCPLNLIKKKPNRKETHANTRKRKSKDASRSTRRK